MPIRNLQRSTRQGLPRLGKLRKGGAKPARGLGRDLTYFRFTSDDGDDKLERVFRDAYGDEPSALAVYLPYTDVASNFSAWREEWAGGRLIHRCDGEYCIKWLGDDSRYVYDPEMTQEHPCPYRGSQPADKRCREVGRLQLVLPALWEAGYAGLVTLETHSVNDIVHIESVLREVTDRTTDKEMGLRGVQFVLRRSPQRINRPTKDGRTVPTTKWLVRLEPSPEWLLAQLDIARRRQLGIPEAEGPVGRRAGGPAADSSPASEHQQHEVLEGQGTGRGQREDAAGWLGDKDQVHRVLALAKRRRLNRDQVLSALGVQRLGEITYGLDEAMARIASWEPTDEGRTTAEREVPLS